MARDYCPPVADDFPSPVGSNVTKPAPAWIEGSITATREAPFAPGTPCWVDLFSSDTAKSKEFYAELLGWSYVDGGEEFGGYISCTSDGYAVGGMMANDGSSGAPDMWTTYIAANDIDATVANAESGGAQVVAPAMVVGDLGSMAVLIDPAGAVFGVWQSGQHFGFAKYNEPGSVTWDELHTKDFAAATSFYGNVFGWKYDPVSETDEFRYSTAQVDGDTVAGIMDASSYLPDQAPSFWSVYFSVADVDESVALVEKLGGSVTRPAEDTPFGRLADLVDPTGAAFKLHQVLPQA